MKVAADKRMLRDAVALAEKAGAAIMAVYTGGDIGTTYKKDNSPLTRADTASHQVILDGLQKMSPARPVLSEESDAVPYEVRRSWESFWLVDPLDGTKEFIKGNGEFTVNIALIEDRTAVLGVVHAPTLGVTYYAMKGRGAFKQTRETTTQIRTGDYRRGNLRIVASRSNGGEILESFLRKIGTAECVRIGSSLKFCWVAEGAAHLYPRFGPTMEWDTAAAQCVVEAAGGSVTDLEGKSLHYNKADLVNPDFIVSGSPAFHWKQYLHPEEAR
ncbi:MAG: 3'(2'),5'-bisphosphate nucleotidase CysQ [Nitrospirae bacterium]|nr:3'(2'),5'-bisphosphate nucleotidase CysQ [Nitrospirota bacterium]